MKSFNWAFFSTKRSKMVYCCLFMSCIMVRRHTRPIRPLVLPIRPCGPSRAPMPAGAISGYSIVHDPIPHPQRHPLTERREVDLVDLPVVRPIR